MTCGTPRCHCGWPPGRRLPRSARAGHSVHVLLTVYTHCIPGHVQIASHAIEHALRAQARRDPAAHRLAPGTTRGPPSGPQNPRSCRPDPSVIRPHTAIHTGTQLDPTGPAHHGLSARDLRKHRGRARSRMGRPGSHSPRPRPAQAADLPGSGPQLAQRHCERSAGPPPHTHPGPALRPDEPWLEVLIAEEWPTANKTIGLCAQRRRQVMRHGAHARSAYRA
jgi:hypothetical protein